MTALCVKVAHTRFAHAPFFTARGRTVLPFTQEGADEKAKQATKDFRNFGTSAIKARPDTEVVYMFISRTENVGSEHYFEFTALL